MNPLTNFSLSNLLNSWWTLSPSIQEKVKSLVPTKDSWTLHLTKHESGVWVFSLPQFLTFNESLCNGTELVLDQHYEDLMGFTPVNGSKMTLTVSSKPLEDTTTTIEYQGPDDFWTESNYYLDSKYNMLVWLCPYVQVLFKGIPEKMYLNILPTY